MLHSCQVWSQFCGAENILIYLACFSAHEVASSRQHKSISASDVLRALEQMDMGDLVPKLQAELDGKLNP